MSQQQRRRTPTGSSYSAFADVDALVSKPVLGSDGAASWQEFRSQSSSSSARKPAGTTGAGPVLPVKRADRLGTGLKSREEEIRHEEDVRRQAGDVPLGSGYTAFKRKVDAEEAAAKKKAKLIAERVRPDDKRYYIASETFEGWKEDYVFTTRDRGTGYYWDGMDSAKKQLGLSVGPVEGKPRDEGEATDEPAKKRKKKKKKKAVAAEEPIAVVDGSPSNPMEQVAAAIRRRQQAMQAGPPGRGMDSASAAAETAALTGGLAAAPAAVAGGTPGSGSVDDDEVQRLATLGWETATDPTSRKKYYFNRKTGERRWDSPLRTDGNAATTATADAPSGDSSDKTEQSSTLPEGWAAAEDKATGKKYYYHAESGRTQWTRPTS